MASEDLSAGAASQRNLARTALKERLSASLVIPKMREMIEVVEEREWTQYIVKRDGGCKVGKHIGSVSYRKGSFGSVFECLVSEETTSNFAVKIVKINSSQVLKNAVQEFEILKDLRHPNIISAYRFLIDPKLGQTEMVMERFRGKSIAEMLQDEEQWEEGDVRTIAMQLFSALRYLESKRVVHRDITPANILIRGSTVKLLDFETAVRLSPGLLHSIAGTKRYQAPEMWGKTGYDCRVDIWSAGLILRQMSKRVKGGLSASGQDFIRRCLQEDPEHRLTSTEALEQPWLWL